MVCEWGMSKTMGPLTFGKREESIFLGKEFARHQDYSEATAVQIDEEIRSFIDAAYEGASQLIKAHGEVLEAIASALLEHEVLDGEEIYVILAEHSDADVEKIKRQKARDESEVAGPTP
jgi:cell division protease FtsH